MRKENDNQPIAASWRGHVRTTAENIWQAAEWGMVHDLKALIERGADVDSLNKAGQRAISLAAENGFGECVELLAHAGAELDVEDQYGFTPLMRLASWMLRDAGETLVRCGCDIDHQNRKGQTALMFAAGSRSKDFLKMLLASRVDLDLVDKEGLSAMDWAVKQKRDSGRAVKTLIAAERARRERVSLEAEANRAPTARGGSTGRI